MTFKGVTRTMRVSSVFVAGVGQYVDLVVSFWERASPFTAQ